MVELSALSSWQEMAKGQIEESISKLKQNFIQPTGKVLQNADVKACLSDLHNKYVFVKTGLEKYCSINTSHTGVNNMWILKNSTNLLSLGSP